MLSGFRFIPFGSFRARSHFKISSFLASQSSNLKHATFCKLKPGFFVVSTCQPPRNTSHTLPGKLSTSGGGAPGSGPPGSGAPGSGAPGSGAPGSGAPCYVRTLVHLIAFSRCGLKFFFSFFRNSRTASLFVSSLSIRTASTAKHNTPQRNHPCTKQQTKYVPIRVRIKKSMHVHACCVRFVFLEHGALAFASRLFVHLKCWTIYLPGTTNYDSVCHSNVFFLVSERSGRNRQLREAP